jgi:hypothetical protein
MSKLKQQRIDKVTLEQALDSHAEALFKRRAGSDATPYKHNNEAAALFHLNKELYAALVPVEPTDSFVDQLRMELVSAHQGDMTRRKRVLVAPKRNLMQTAFSFFTVAAMIARILAPIVVVAAFILARRRRAASAPA